MISTALMAETIEPGLTEVLQNAFDEVPEQHLQFFKVKDSENANEDYITIAMFGSMPEKYEGQPVQLDELREAYKTTLTAKTFSLGVRITREAVEDAKYGILNGISAGLGVSGRDAAENSGANIWNRGFNDSYVGGDSEPLFGDNSARTHPLKGGGTWRNTLSSAADLAFGSLDQALIDIRSTVNDRGLLIRLTPELLVVPPELETTALQLVGSDLQPFTQENQVNVFRKRLKVAVWDYLTDTDGWGIMCREHKMIFQNRVPLGTEMEVFRGDMIYTARRRFVHGWKDPRGVFGVEGA